jgi:hypothetical protein
MGRLALRVLLRRQVALEGSFIFEGSSGRPWGTGIVDNGGRHDASTRRRVRREERGGEDGGNHNAGL